MSVEIRDEFKYVVLNKLLQSIEMIGVEPRLNAIVMKDTAEQHIPKLDSKYSHHHISLKRYKVCLKKDTREKRRVQ